ncbi:MAG: 50S ribosomal protein L15 [Pseudomonadota bacterium]|jgi:large subunit ribosomal protein L15|nr:50S ribosomal protein L15 [Pseudomonadota bacterium]QKK05380.1 MAG: 50S ribosomal protein L15 [Pseudomonadota bacterium]|tara:strand:+ start:2299 stop:2790 length:492 start_codon:yes stop_codon:yes gene_type:complete
MKLNELKGKAGSSKSRMRVGRGIGSGKGKTCGRGQKGQKSRTGVAIKGFEGGQMPIYRRLPKRGFHNPTRKNWATVNLSTVQTAIDKKLLDAGKVIDAAALVNAGLVKRTAPGVRLLGQGEIKSKVTFKITGATKTAVAAVEKAGGKVEFLPAPKKIERKKAI